MIKYIDFHAGTEELYRQYADEVTKPLKLLPFKKVWSTPLLKVGVTDPETGVDYSSVYLNKNRAKSFTKCNKCQYFQMRLRGTTDMTIRASLQCRFHQHLAEVTDDREELARIQRFCMVNKHHCGFYLDATDSAKF